MTISTKFRRGAGNVMAFVCPYCAASFGTRQALGGHMSLQVCAINQPVADPAVAAAIEAVAVGYDEHDDLDDGNDPAPQVHMSIARLLQRPTVEYARHRVVKRPVAITAPRRNEAAAFPLHQVFLANLLSCCLVNLLPCCLVNLLKI